MTNTLPQRYVGIIYDQETGEFWGVLENEKYVHKDTPPSEPGGLGGWEPANGKENIRHLSRFDWVQHENIELYHDINKSICSIHVLCKLYKCC